MTAPHPAIAVRAVAGSADKAPVRVTAVLAVAERAEITRPPPTAVTVEQAPAAPEAQAAIRQELAV